MDEKINQLPKIAMGAWAWGDTDGYFGNTMTGEDFRPVFDAAVKAGLNLRDTATAYSNGESEKILGRLVNDAGREKIIVSTKFTPQMAGMYGDSVVKMCEASLERMNMEYFDIYWIHNHDAEHPFPEGSARAKVFNPMLPPLNPVHLLFNFGRVKWNKNGDFRRCRK